MSNQNAAEALWRAYEATRFRAQTPTGTIEIRIGKVCPELNRVCKDNGSTSWCFITAWNPGTERPEPEENDRRNIALRSDLTAAGCEVYDGCGVGEDPSWKPEESFLALGISEASQVTQRQMPYARRATDTWSTKHDRAGDFSTRVGSYGIFEI
jgi:hypothetical protein